MKTPLMPAVVVAVLIFVIAIVFKSIGKSMEVVPLFLVPVFFYVGYLTSKSAKTMLAVTVAVTAALGILYALA